MSHIARVLVALALVITVGSGAGFAASKCGGAKAKAAGKKVSSKLSCHAKAILKGIAVDPTCLAKAEEKFSAAFAKAEAKSYPDDGCLTTGDAATIEAKIDEFVDELAEELAPRPGLPPCLNAGSACGSCGNGICLAHIGSACDVNFPVCAANPSGRPGCSTDADCPAGEFCANTLCGGSGGCAVPCP